jgi:hypothetical protein
MSDQWTMNLKLLKALNAISGALSTLQSAQSGSMSEEQRKKFDEWYQALRAELDSAIKQLQEEGK